VADDIDMASVFQNGSVRGLQEPHLGDMNGVVPGVSQPGSDGRRQSGVYQDPQTGSTAGSSRSCMAAAAKASAS